MDVYVGFESRVLAAWGRPRACSVTVLYHAESVEFLCIDLTLWDQRSISLNDIYLLVFFWYRIPQAGTRK
jgi:hypothetical protein